MTNNELRKLAEAATPGGWFFKTTGLAALYAKVFLVIGGEKVEVDHRICYFNQGRNRTADAAYVSAVSPSVVIGLLDRIESLERGKEA